MNFSLILQNREFIAESVGVTILISSLSFMFAFLLALLIGTIRAVDNQGPIARILGFGVEIFRGTPLLIQLFFIYYGLPSIGIVMDNYVAAVIGLSLNGAAYISEIIRASILSIDSGQWAAAQVLGFSNAQTWIYIIYPQSLRIALPSLMNSFSSLLKESSLVSVLAITELTRSGQLLYSRTYRAFEIYLLLGVLYFVMTFSVSFLSRQLEKMMGKAYRR